MGLPVETHRHTVEEYLRLEEKSVGKNEFHDGEILAMSGGSYEHSRITANVIGALGNRLAGSPCYVLDSNMRVRVGLGSDYVYPDASILCGDPVFDPADRNRTTVLNPRVVVEVLSDSTEAYDRGGKFALYRDVPSLAEYVLVSQRGPAIDTFRRGADGSWVFSPSAGLGAAAKLPSVGIELPLAEVYAGINFPVEQPAKNEAAPGSVPGAAE